MVDYTGYKIRELLSANTKSRLRDREHEIVRGTAMPVLEGLHHRHARAAAGTVPGGPTGANGRSDRRGLSHQRSTAMGLFGRLWRRRANEGGERRGDTRRVDRSLGAVMNDEPPMLLKVLRWRAWTTEHRRPQVAGGESRRNGAAEGAQLSASE